MKSLSLTKPHMIIMVGIPGSGKTFFAHQFADTFHAPSVTYDAIREHALSDAAATTLAYSQLDQLTKTRQSVIVDGLATTRVERNELMKYATKANYEPLYIWVQTDLAAARQRVTKSKDTTKPALTSDEFIKATKRFAEPTSSERSIVISGKHTYATQARIVLKKLSAPRTETASHDIPPARVEPLSSERKSHTIIVR